MAKLNGGEFLLDLTPIEVEESVDTETYTSITNVDVLKQLTNLKRYIVNPSAIKPVWVKFVNSETDEIVVVKGELSKVIDSDEFDIHVKTKGYDLTIHVEFTQALNEDEDPIDDWYIDTNDAKYLFTSNVVSGGTKLYQHKIELDTPTITNLNDTLEIEDTTLPIYIISTNPNPYDLSSSSNYRLSVGFDGVIAISLKAGTPFGYIDIDGANDVLILYSNMMYSGDTVGQRVNYDSASSNTDTVTPL